jgi:serine O-acetyltransferase
MDNSFLQTILQAHKASEGIPRKEAVYGFAENLLKVLFPQFASKSFSSAAEVQDFLGKLSQDFVQLLKSSRYHTHLPDTVLTEKFFSFLPVIYTQLLKDAEAIVREDPAAKDIHEVILTYPGFYTIAIYRMAHVLYKLDVPYIPRMLTEYAHQKTGIDIHPGAQIGSYFCIDHGTGIVIGQTTVIGNHVKLYQGVTLGAVSVEKGLANVKRHPTIGDYVVIYANATILGGEVVIGEHSVIGGNVWLTESVPAYSKVYHKSQIKVSGQKAAEQYLEFYI